MTAGSDRAQETIRAISARDARAARMYHGLSGRARRSVVNALDHAGLKALTGLIKEHKKKRFTEGNERFLAVAEGAVRTPSYLLDETLIEENMRVLRYVKDRTGCKILHALKSYASFVTFPMMRRYLDGTCASGLNEARLGREEFGGEVHTFGAAYRETKRSEGY